MSPRFHITKGVLYLAIAAVTPLLLNKYPVFMGVQIAALIVGAAVPFLRSGVFPRKATKGGHSSGGHW